MSPPRQPITTSAWVAALVRHGVAAFAANGASGQDALLDALGRETAVIWRAAAPPDVPPPTDWPALLVALEAVWPPSEGPLGALIGDLGMTPAEVFVLGLAGAVEESHLLGLVLDRLQAPTGGARPGVHLALALVTELFGAAALDVHRLLALPLVREGVLVMDGDAPLPSRRLRLHPALWSALNGHPMIWPGCTPGPDPDAPTLRETLPSALLAQVPKLADLLLRGDSAGLTLRGPPGSGRGRFAAVLAAAAGHTALEVPVALWEQEPALPLACRYGGWLPVLRPRLGPGESWQPPRPGVIAPGPCVVLLGPDGAIGSGADRLGAETGLLEVALPVLDPAERRALWTRHLGDEALATRAANALLGGPVIVGLATQARLLAKRAAVAVADRHVAEARGLLGAEGLRLLAQPVAGRVDAAALVLPPLVRADLDAAIARARQRETVLDGLGPTLAATPNPGLRLLLVGESGTGKTLAASYVAGELGAPLYRVDLAAVMNKYIGESEKNLGALLDQAVAHDVVLLFDEADSVFGRRTERKETGERYANMLTNFLLTRIEAHPGIVVLTTNSRERIDPAFTRRLDQIIEVPLPGFEERLRLWRSHLGKRGPGEALCRSLAGYCDLAGGQVRNAVLTASAQAAGGPIGLAELLAGLRSEYRKMGRALPPQVERMQAGLTVVPAPGAAPDDRSAGAAPVGAVEQVRP